MVSKVAMGRRYCVGNGFIHIVRCRVGLLIEGKDKIVGCEWDILTKHQGCRIVHHDLLILGMKKGGEYIAKDCTHVWPSPKCNYEKHPICSIYCLFM